MNPSPLERWPDLDEVFAQALELPAAERSVYLDRRCPDREMREEVLALLLAERSSRRFFEHPAPDPWSTGPDGAPRGRAPALGDVVGSYRLLETVGHGGTSTVHVAERADGAYRQKVAIKVLDPSLMARGAVERFDQERQILAGLRHPNVARLLDGGITAGGWPFIVMEHVKGVSIDRYCDDKRLSIEGRLALFRTTCDAVHAAHRALVVHRDLKPGNVLVTEEGWVKLVDFGIAKVLGEGGGGPSSIVTQTGIHPMTPAYAAPEQISGEPVTTATDVYQLGALLFELLTGRRPFAGATTLEGLRERLDRDGPEPPSRVVTRVDGGPDNQGAAPAEDSGSRSVERLAELRGTSAWALRSRLQGDLDTMILTAMKSDPARRYASAEALSQDVGRYLEGRPLLAHPDSLAYRASKFVRRHPVGAALSAVGLASLVFVSTILVGQYRRAERERDKAQAVTDFLVGLFERPDPGSEEADTLTARALLAEGARSVDDALADQPLARAAVMNAVGEAYFGLGRLSEASDLLTSALDLRRRMLPEGDPEIGESLVALGEVALEQRDFQSAEGYFRDALHVRRGAHPWRSPEVAEALAGLGLTLHAQGSLEQASGYYQQTIDIYRGGRLPHDQTLAEALANMGWLHSREGRLREAEALLRESLVVRTALYGERHASVATALSGLAEVERSRGGLDSAAVHAGAAITIFENLYGHASQRVVGPLITRAGIRTRAGRITEAEDDYRRALSIVTDAFGLESPDAARVLNDLGSMLRTVGRFGEAEELLTASVAAYTAALGPRHFFTGIVMSNLGATLSAAGREQEAIEVLRTSLAILDENGQGESSFAARALMTLGGTDVDRESAEAEEALRRSLAIWNASAAPDPEQVGSAKGYLGRRLARRDAGAEAERLLLDAYEALSAVATDSPSTRRVAGWLADYYEATGDPSESARFRAASDPGA